jgi:hypothetical protein
VSWTVWLTPLLPLLGALPGGEWVLPLIAPLTVYPEFARRVRNEDLFDAWRLGLLWAALLSLGVILLVAVLPAVARGGIWQGEPYRVEMFGWVTTGIAPENDWQQFLPQHVLHLGIFVALSWVSGGYLGLALGALLVDYMSYFVGSFAMVSRHPVLGAMVAWVPWSVIRVLAFVLLGVLFARPLLRRTVWPFGSRELRLLGLAASGILADILIKLLAARGYGLFLRSLLLHS